jgi:serine protease inhibitor
MGLRGLWILLITLVSLLCAGCLVKDAAAGAVDISADALHTAADAI